MGSSGRATHPAEVGRHQGGGASLHESLDVLIVEDDPGDATLIQKMLERSARWRVQTTCVQTLADAEVALAKPSFPVDLVLLDMRLPDGDGLDALGRVLAHRSGVAVVVLTGVDDESLARACLEAGAVDYVRKASVFERSFVRTVDYALARSRNLRLKSQLEDVGRLAALGEIAAGVAHEINNPATYVRYNIVEVREELERLAGELEPTRGDVAARLGEMCRVLHSAYDGLERITSVVRELQGHARKNTSDEARVVDPVAVVRSSLKLVDHQIRHWAGLDVDLQPCPPLAINPQRLGQIVANLVLNAGQALRDTPSPPPVRIALRPDGDVAELTVADCGTGIPAGDLPSIFDSFYTTKHNRGGTGLGLAITHDIITSVGGTIEVESSEGVGSTFTVRIPVCEVPAATQPEPRIVAGDRRRVLVVDDDALVLRALSRVLSTYHEVHAAEGGAEALGLLERLEGQVDVVFCDLMMPEMDGAETLDRVFRRYPHLRERSFVLSGGATTLATRDFLESEGVRMLQKPVGVEALLRLIDEQD